MAQSYHPVQCQLADTLMTLDIDGLPAVVARAQDDAAQTAKAYARTQLLKYSAEHPRRECTFCAAMGTATLHVESRLYGTRQDWQLSASDDASNYGRTIDTPKFLLRLQALGQGVGFLHDDWFGPLLLRARGGVMVTDKTDW